MGDIMHDLEASSEELIETHISWVFLHACDVYKLKKPVDFGFLDFSTIELRRAACLAELELNSRLAPGTYLDVLPVTRDSSGQHRVAAGSEEPAGKEGGEEIVDYVVHMSRLPVTARADLRLERAELRGEDIDALAVLLARFHERAAHTDDIARFGDIAVIRGNVEENFEQASALLQKLAPAALEREVEQRQLAFLAKHEALFARRVAEGRIRDGHGDLRLEHVYLLEGRDAAIIDCIEFNQRFRYADVCADLAFLSMDLGMHGRHDYKERLLAAYAAASGDYDLYALCDFYESYRGYVRAKVSAFSLQGSRAFGTREKLEAEARRYLLASLAAERPPLVPPRLVAVGGLIASGKSTLARALGERLSAPVVGSDDTRKRLLGVEPTAPVHAGAWQAAYSDEATERVYREVLRRARVVLESGRTVIIDASFKSRADRARARELARSLGVAFSFIECQVPENVARARLHERARGPSVSDGRLEIFDDFVARYETVTELDPAEHQVVDTQGPLTGVLESLARAGLALDARPG